MNQIIFGATIPIVKSMRVFFFADSGVVRLLAFSICFGSSITCASQYTLTVESAPAAEVADQTVYRFYVNMETEEDEISAVYGTSAKNFILDAPSGVFNSGFNGNWSAAGINPAFLTIVPELVDDTYATIGLTGPASASGLSDAQDPQYSDFNGTILPFFLSDGAVLLSTAGSSYFVTPGAANARPQNDDLRVLIMQVTTPGSISGQIVYQLFPGGIQSNVVRYSVAFAGAGTFESTLFIEVVGCMDYTACNYNPEANLEPIGICEYGSSEDYDECGVCNGLGAIYACGCSPIPEGDCDCEGSQIDAIGVCGGGCSADEDVDGICDDVDDCIGSLDACGICNGPGDIFACGCFPIPEGDCDCEGNQNDAIGVCGGLCSADEDADGICDDADDCIGALDACGICNGPGDIFTCGCFPIPEGECDCQGNVEDECGVCGGQNGCFGCTDLGACNYDPTASIENGSCEYLTCAGCTEPSACNFDQTATIDDGSCFFGCCLVPESCNYSPDPTEDVGGCDFSCFCIADEGENSPCFNMQEGVEVQEAFAIDVVLPFYSCDDSITSCGDSIIIAQYLWVCTYLCGCTDADAVNYSAESNADNGLCEYFQTSCEFLGDDAWDDYDPGIYTQSPPIHLLGAPDSVELVLHVPEVLTDATTGSDFAVTAWEDLTISGMPSGLAFDSFPTSLDGNTELCVSYSGTPLELGTFEVNVTGEMILDFFGTPYSIGNISSTLTIVVESNPNPIPGCTYEHAVNHSPIASVDDGSCIFTGCTDPSASNYEPYATVDDGTCDSEPCDDVTASNMGDLNNDGSVGAGDLLQFLSVYGVSYLDEDLKQMQPLHGQRRRMTF